MTFEEWEELHKKLEEEGYDFKSIGGKGYETKKIKITPIGRPDESSAEVKYTFEEHVLHPYHLHTLSDYIAEIAIPIVYGHTFSLESLFKNTER